METQTAKGEHELNCSVESILPVIFGCPNFITGLQDYRNWILVGVSLEIPAPRLNKLRKTATNQKHLYGLVNELIESWINEKAKTGTSAKISDLVSALKEHRLEAFAEALEKTLIMPPPSLSSSRLTSLSVSNASNSATQKIHKAPYHKQMVSDRNLEVSTNQVDKDQKLRPATNMPHARAVADKNTNVDERQTNNAKSFMKISQEKPSHSSRPLQKEIELSTQNLPSPGTCNTRATVTPLPPPVKIIAEKSNSNLAGSSRKMQNKAEDASVEILHTDRTHKESNPKTLRKESTTGESTPFDHNSESELQSKAEHNPRDSTGSTKKPKIEEMLAKVKVKQMTTKKTEKFTPFHKAVKANQTKVVLELLRSGQDINERTTDKFRNTALHLTALHITQQHHYKEDATNKEDAIKTIKILINEGADVSAKNSNDETFMDMLLFHRITPTKFHELVKIMFDSGHEQFLFSQNEQNDGCVFHWAVKTGIMEKFTLAYIKGQGYNLNFVSKAGNSLIYYAIWGERSNNFLQYLIDAGVNWRFPNSSGWNVLHTSARFGNAKAFKFFLKLQPDFVTNFNKNGQTPFDMLRIYHFNEVGIIEEMIRSYWNGPY